MSHLSVESLPEPGDRYVLGDVLGIGVWAKVVIVAYYEKCYNVFMIKFSNERRFIKPVILRRLEKRLR